MQKFYVNMQVTWMVCRKFQFQAFNYIDKNGKGTLRLEDAAKCIPATAFLVSDHLSQLIITDGMSREGASLSACGNCLLYGTQLVTQGFQGNNSAMLYVHATSYSPGAQ